MAFGFFKKAEKADIIFKGGKIYTQDADLPWAEAVACREGRIIAVGDAESVEGLADSGTEVVDLGGGTMLPGFIDLDGAPAARVFSKSYLDLADCDTWEEIVARIGEVSGESTPVDGMQTLSDIFSGNISMDDNEGDSSSINQEPGDGVFGAVFAMPSNSTEDDVDDEFNEIDSEPGYDVEGAIFAFAGKAQTPEGTPEEVRAQLDAVAPNVPVVILFALANMVILNSKAISIAKQAAEENGIPQISLSFLVEILELVDFEELQHSALELAAGYCERGYTSVVNNGFLDYFDQTYQDMLVDAYQNDMLKQRFFGKYGVRGPVYTDLLIRKLRQRQTLCMDMDGFVNADGLQIDMVDGFDYDALHDMVLTSADAGMNIRILAHDHESSIDALEFFEEAQNKGYRKNIYTLVHELEFSEEERLNADLGGAILEAPLTGCEYVENSKLPGEGGFNMNVGEPEITRGIGAVPFYAAADVSEAIDLLTCEAALAIGKDDELGSIERGKLADFVVFEKNPLECTTLNELKKMRAKQTILNGKTVYDEEEDVAEEWYNLLVNQQF